MQKTIEEVRDWLLENRVNGKGDLDLRGLDFSKFKGNILIGNMKVNKGLYFNNCEVGGDVEQSFHKVKGDLSQYNHKVAQDLFQSSHQVFGNLYQGNSKVIGDFSNYGDEVAGLVRCDCKAERLKLKEVSEEELALMGYKVKGRIKGAKRNYGNYL